MDATRNDEALCLLQTGAASYHDAIVALAAFRQEVYRSCERVVASQLSGLANAVGAVISMDDVRRYTVDEVPKDPSEVYLSLQTQNPEMKKLRMAFYVGLAWWEEEDQRCFGVHSGFWVSRKAGYRLKELLNEFNDDDGKPSVWEEEGIYIAYKLDWDQAGRFESKLGELIDRWIAVGTKCGGLLKLVSQPDAE